MGLNDSLKNFLSNYSNKQLAADFVKGCLENDQQLIGTLIAAKGRMGKLLAPEQSAQPTPVARAHNYRGALACMEVVAVVAGGGRGGHGHHHAAHRGRGAANQFGGGVAVDGFRVQRFNLDHVLDAILQRENAAHSAVDGCIGAPPQDDDLDRSEVKDKWIVHKK